MQDKSFQYQHLLLRAKQQYQNGRRAEARRSCEQLLKLKRSASEPLYLLARISWDQADHNEAVSLLEKYVRLHPNDLESRYTLGKWLMVVNRGRAAASQFQQLLKSQPKNPAVVAGLASAHIMAGSYDKADRLLKPLIENGGEHWSIAHTYVVAQYDQKNYAEAIRIAQRHIENPKLEDAARRGFCLTLGQSLEKIGEFDAAFEAYERAHSNMPATFKPEAIAHDLKVLMNLFTPQLLDDLPRADPPTDLPVFLVSLPRAGSTLVERIITAHPSAHAGGELAFMRQLIAQWSMTIGATRPYPQSVRDLDQSDVDLLADKYINQMKPLAPTAMRITSKNLGNWHRAGLIDLMLPQSRIIDIRRDALDQCFSCYTSRLDASHDYVHDLRHLGLIYCAHEAMMKHWLRVLQIPVLTVNYEDLIADQEHWTRRIIEFCKLPWHDDCLRFHEKAAGPGQTAAMTVSYNQVRQPLYNSSVRRAEKFDKYLGPLKEGLEEGRRLWGLDNQA